MEPKETLRFHEIQYFPLWFWALPFNVCTMCLMFRFMNSTPEYIKFSWVMIAYTVPFTILLGAALGKMTTELSNSELRVGFGWLPIYRIAIPLHHVQGFEATLYKPISMYGGWGMHGSLKDGGALNARGNRGVALLLDNGKTLIVGSRKPEVLVEALGKLFESSVM